MESAKIKNIAVLGGSGQIGSGWATNFLWKGYPVSIYDVSDECLQTVRGRIRGNLEYLVNKGVLTADKMNVALSLAKFTTKIEEALQDVQFIQEAVPEKYEIKQAVLKEVDRYAAQDAVFASSTSGLLITEIAKYSSLPERCLGAHPYNPPHLIPLVEISKGEKTNESSIRKAYDFYRSWGKSRSFSRRRRSASLPTDYPLPYTGKQWTSSSEGFVPSKMLTRRSHTDPDSVMP